MYSIVFTKQAVRSLRKMPAGAAGLIRDKLEQIAHDPFASHPNACKLQNREGYRLRVGDWRIIYEIHCEEIVVFSLKIARRGEVVR